MSVLLSALALLAATICGTGISSAQQSVSAETRFMKLSDETVGGRRVKGDGGYTYTFYKDKRFEWNVKGERTSRGKWNIATNSIIITWNSVNFCTIFPTWSTGECTSCFKAEAAEMSGCCQSRPLTKELAAVA